MKRIACVIAALAVCIALALPATRACAAPGTRTVYLIRHGDYNYNDPKDEVTGRGLTRLGREQAKFVATRLSQLPVPIRSLHSSMLLRAVQTADVVAGVLKLPVDHDSLLNECTPPTNRPDIMATLRPGEADSAQAQLDRAWFQYFDVSQNGDAHDVLVCHGNVIRWFVCRALGADTKQWGSMEIGNCSMTIITIKPDGTARLVMFDDVSHIPVAKQTWAGAGPGWAKPKKQNPRMH